MLSLTSPPTICSCTVLPLNKCSAQDRGSVIKNRIEITPLHLVVSKRFRKKSIDRLKLQALSRISGTSATRRNSKAPTTSPTKWRALISIQVPNLKLCVGLASLRCCGICSSIDGQVSTCQMCHINVVESIRLRASWATRDCKQWTKGAFSSTNSSSKWSGARTSLTRKSSASLSEETRRRNQGSEQESYPSRIDIRSQTILEHHVLSSTAVTTRFRPKLHVYTSR